MENRSIKDEIALLKEMLQLAQALKAESEECGNNFKIFRGTYSSPPVQAPVGRAPEKILAGTPIPQKEWPGHYLIGNMVDRGTLREICRDDAASERAAFVCAMAWGAGPYLKKRIDEALSSPALKKNLGKLRQGMARAEAFALMQDAQVQGEIKGLGISYFTKLLYFFLPEGNAYILDQWTAKSWKLLDENCPLRFQGDLPHPKTTPNEYEQYCQFVEALADKMGWENPADAEIAMFSSGGKTPGKWREYVMAHFQPEKALPFTPKQGQKKTPTVGDPLPDYPIFPVYILADCGGNGSVKLLGEALKKFPDKIVTDPVAVQTTRASIIGFNGEAKLALANCKMSDFSAPELLPHEGGIHSLGSACRLLMNQVGSEIRENVDQHPMVYILLNGDPTDDWEKAADSLQERVGGYSVVIDLQRNVTSEKMRRLTSLDDVYRLKDTSPDTFIRLINWMGSSVKQTSVRNSSMNKSFIEEREKPAGPALARHAGFLEVV